MANSLTTPPKELPEFKAARETVDAAIKLSKNAPAKIDNGADLEEATEIVSRLANARKEAEQQRKAVKQPLTDAGKAIDAEWREMVGPIDGAEKAVKDVILEHHRKQEESAAAERKRLEENARRRQQREDEKAKKEERQPVQHVAQPVAQPEQTTRTESGARATVTKRWTFEVEDVTQLPAAYLLPNKAELTKAVAKGAREIPGVRIFEKAGVAAG